MDVKNEAISFFKRTYGKTPQEMGFTEFDIYKKQNAFLYASSQQVIKAYKMQQNILRWIMRWYLAPMIVALLSFFTTLGLYNNPVNLLCLAHFVFFGIWIILFIVLWIKVFKAQKIVKPGENITYLNY